jgi:hypothetical protein
VIRWLALGATALAAFSCGAPPPIVDAPPPPLPRVVPAPSAPVIEPFDAAPGEARFTRVLSKRFQLSVPLPNRSGWVALPDRKSSFLAFEHPSTQSRLVLRLWREDERMHRDVCEQRARLARDLPTRGRTIDSRQVDAPRGFDTQADVGFTEASKGAPIVGYLLGFGASGRRCFAFSFDTQASGADAERIVGDRLAVILGITLEGVEIRSDLDVR